jgi:hypothetical protein
VLSEWLGTKLFRRLLTDLLAILPDAKKRGAGESKA